MAEDLKAKLLARRLDEDTVELSVGTVTVRGLSRGEVFAAQKTTNNTESLERRTVSLGMVDPPMSEDEVKQWQENSPAGELEKVTAKIQELSGLNEGADKSGVSDVRDES